MLKVGITGGIGSGKTTICNFFDVLGLPIFIADTEAKRIMDSSPIVRSKLILSFGEEIYLPNHALDRKKLAKMVFNSPLLLAKINSIVHPEVHKHFQEWCNRQDSPYIVYEAAILFESGFYQEMDFNILVTAPEEERVKRVLLREHTTENDIKNRIAKQWQDNEKEELADFIIANNNRELIIPQLIELDKKFRIHE